MLAMMKARKKLLQSGETAKKKKEQQEIAAAQASRNKSMSVLLSLQQVNNVGARPAPVSRPILPSFLVLAGACPLMFAGSDTDVKLCGCTTMRTNSCLTPRIVGSILPQASTLTGT